MSNDTLDMKPQSTVIYYDKQTTLIRFLMAVQGKGESFEKKYIEDEKKSMNCQLTLYLTRRYPFKKPANAEEGG